MNTAPAHSAAVPFSALFALNKSHRHDAILDAYVKLQLGAMQFFVNVLMHTPVVSSCFSSTYCHSICFRLARLQARKRLLLHLGFGAVTAEHCCLSVQDGHCCGVAAAQLISSAAHAHAEVRSTRRP